MAGERFYSDADILRMQRDAEGRVQEMRRLTLQMAQDMEGDVIPMPSFVNPNRNWNPNPSGRQERRQPVSNHDAQPQPEARAGYAAETSPPEAPYVMEAESARFEPHTAAYTEPNSQPTGHEASPNGHQNEAPPSPPFNATTVAEDIVGRLGLESDTLLIIGLILILINQKADQTLILALAYLLF